MYNVLLKDTSVISAISTESLLSFDKNDILLVSRKMIPIFMATPLGDMITSATTELERIVLRHYAEDLIKLDIEQTPVLYYLEVDGEQWRFNDLITALSMCRDITDFRLYRINKMNEVATLICTRELGMFWFLPSIDESERAMICLFGNDTLGPIPTREVTNEA